MGDRVERLHIVQVGYDDSVFDNGAASDTLARQRAYASELQEQRPASRLTYCVLTTRRDARTFTTAGLTVVPVYGLTLRAAQLRLLGVLRRVHREMPIWLVATQTPYADAAASLLFGYLHSIPTIGQVHYHFDAIGAPRRTITSRLARWIIPRCAAIRTVGQGTAKSIEASGLSRNVHTIPVPVTMPGGTARVSTREPTVLFVGSLVDVKNPLGWLSVAEMVAERCPDARFVVAGDGPLSSRVRARAGSGILHGRVEVLGALPYDELSELYANASVLLLTSVSEGFGRVAVEAYRHGTPVVGTNVGGLSDIVTEGVSGYLRQPDDFRGLAECVSSLLEDDRLCEQFGKAGLDSVREQFDTAKLVRMWMALLVETAERDLVLRKPQVPTLRRWRNLRSGRYSLLRQLEYERLAEVQLYGVTLDVGGGARADYRSLLRAPSVLHSVNIDPGMRPTFIADLNVAIPVADSTYDSVVTLNTLEHVRCDTVAIAEIVRVLKPSGTMHIFVPFLYRVHAEPHDYHRHTWHWWRAYLTSCGVAPETIRIEPLVWDRLSSAYSMVEHTPGMQFFKGPLMLVGILRATFGGLRSRSDYALGYYISGHKAAGRS